MEKDTNKVMDIDFEEVFYDNLEEIEEVITPFDGTIMCCE